MFRQIGILIGHASDTPAHTIITVVIGTAAFALVEFIFHIALASLGVPILADAVVDAGLCGLTFGILLWVALAAIRERRLRVREDLDRISDVNHEIRNALEIITQCQFNAEPTHREMVLESVNRIDAVLKRTFPTVGH